MFNENLVLLGFPNNDGDNKGFVCPETQFCVSSKIAAPEGAYEFINYMFKLGSENSKYTFPSEKTAFESVVKKASEPPAPDDPLVKLDPLTPEEIKTFSDYILSCTVTSASDPTLNNILSEETSAFFAGQKSAEEVADVLNNRITTYLNE